MIKGLHEVTNVFIITLPLCNNTVQRAEKHLGLGPVFPQQINLPLVYSGIKSGR